MNKLLILSLFALLCVSFAKFKKTHAAEEATQGSLEEFTSCFKECSKSKGYVHPKLLVCCEKGIVEDSNKLYTCKDDLRVTTAT